MNKQTKRWGAALLAAGVLAGVSAIPTSYTWAAQVKQQSPQQQGITLKWNGTALKTKGIQIKGSTMIPIAALRDELRIPVSFDKASKTYTVGSGYNKLNITPFENDAYVNVNGVSTRSMEAKLVNGKLYVPIGIVKEYMGLDAEWNGATKTVSLSKSQLNGITITSETLTNSKDKKVSYHLKYPQISGTQLTDEAKKSINGALKGYAEQVLASAKKELAEGGVSPDRPYEYESDFAVAFNKDGVLSVIMQDYSYTGGAHGMTNRIGYTFSLADGKQLQLSDVLKANPDYKKLLNQQLTKKVNGLDGGMGGFKGISADPNYYVTSGGIVIMFQLYEYTPYAYGIPEFPFSFSELLPKGGKPFTQ